MTRVQADILPAVRDWLAARADGFDVQLEVPVDWAPRSGPALLIVADDGGPVRWPVKSQHTIRLTGYAAGRTEARRIATLAAGLLGDGRPTGVAGIQNAAHAGFDARDKATGAVLASVLLTVHARTVEV